MQVQLGDGTTTWAFLDPETVRGTGLVAPRLAFHFTARTPRDDITAQLHVLRGELMAGDERLGEGLLTGATLSSYELHLALEVPVSRTALEYLDQIAKESQIDVVLRLSGWLRARDNNSDAPRFASSPPAGEWVFQGFGIGRQTELLFRIARSDWFTQVLEPIGTVEYLCTAIAVPRGDHPLRDSANHLRAAERALRQGHDPQVFSECRAAVEALPGGPQHIFDRLENKDERKNLDELLRGVGQYFHLGRHTANEGPQLGQFPIDHADAAFALNLAKLLLAQTAHVLDRPPR